MSEADWPTELPSMQHSNYTSNSYALGGVQAGGWVETTTTAPYQQLRMQEMGHRLVGTAPPFEVPPQPKKEKAMAKPTRRLVKVIIVDPDEKMPLDKALVYSGDEVFTDLTDQELFFELDIKKLLEEHNAKRVTVRDKEVKSKEIFLEPVKVRDLKMNVVEIAVF